MCDVNSDIIYEMANDSLFVILLLCICYVIVLAKRLDALLSILGPRSLNRKGPHLSRYSTVPKEVVVCFLMLMISRVSV